MSFSIVGGTITLFHNCEYIDYIEENVALDKDGFVFFGSTDMPFKVTNQPSCNLQTLKHTKRCVSFAVLNVC